MIWILNHWWLWLILFFIGWVIYEIKTAPLIEDENMEI